MKYIAFRIQGSTPPDSSILQNLNEDSNTIWQKILKTNSPIWKYDHKRTRNDSPKEKEWRENSQNSWPLRGEKGVEKVNPWQEFPAMNIEIQNHNAEDFFFSLCSNK